MIASIWNDLKSAYGRGDMVTRLVIVNVAVFAAINIVKITLFLTHAGQTPLLYDDILHFFCISTRLSHNLTHPWAAVTSMFLHEGFWHILWNMLFLATFGRIVGDFIGNQRVLPLYLLGGFVGAIIYWVGSLLLPTGYGFALGASAAVMSFVVAAATISPDYPMRVLLIGDVKLKYIALVLVFLDLIGIANVDNTGGHFAHLGGALFGWFFVEQLRQGRDLAVPINQFFDSVGRFFKKVTQKSPRPRPKMAYKNEEKASRQKNGTIKATRSSATAEINFQNQLDGILEKIKQNGYESLSADEKAFLFQASKK